MRYILLGDTHFGLQKFSIEVLDNQVKFFKEQLIPFMLKEGIDTIIQSGDLFDNRTLLDINFLFEFRTKFMSLLVENNIKLLTYLGNHDLYFKNTRQVNFISVLQELYPNTIDLIQNQEIRTVNNKQVGFVPFLVHADAIEENILELSDYIFGHFETKGFEISRGITDDFSELEVSTFAKYSNIKTVFSGHYHIQDTRGLVKYVGVPYNMSWNDYMNPCGFHVLEEDFSIVFHENIESNKYVHVYLNDDVWIDKEKVSKEEFKAFFSKNRYIVKVFLNQEFPFEDYVLHLDDNNIVYTLIDNRDSEEDEQKKVEITSNTETFLHQYIKENHEDLFDIYSDIVKGIE